MFTDILFGVENHIATITLNRPEVMNAFSKIMYDDVIYALRKSNDDPDVRAVVITGSGRNFCAGGDIRSFRRNIDEKVFLPEDGIIKTGTMAMAVRQCSKPVVAMVNGTAAGAGGGLALAADFRVMTPESSLTMAFINLGLTGDTTSFYALARMVGTAKAQEIMMLGAPINGEKAEALGLVTKMAEKDTLSEVAYKLADRLAKGPTKAYSKQKAILYHFFFSNLEEFSKVEAYNMRESSMTSDFDEAVNAFLAKRRPDFKGE
ncbi:Trans-2-decenoyl-[acyl-carrier-protein] isomerase [anaerobic digester metagenome]